MDIFDDPELAELINDAAAEAEELTLPKTAKATPASIDYARSLLERVGDDPDDYDWDNMEQDEASRIIDECKAELGID